MPTQTEPLITEIQARTILPEAIGMAFGELALQGYRREDLHQVAVCAKLADITVGGLTQMHIPGAEHETHISDDLTTHDYPVLRTTAGAIIADGTWQQFLPPDRRSSHLPEVLVGTRGEVAQAARGFGVPEEKISLWRVETKRDLEASRRADANADAAANRADQAGRWDIFMSDNRQPGASSRGRHRAKRSLLGRSKA